MRGRTSEVEGGSGIGWVVGCEYLSSAWGPGRAARPRNCCPPPLLAPEQYVRARPRPVPAR